MAGEVLSIGVGLFLAVTVVAIGAYVGALRALDTYYSDEDSIFLSEDAGPRGRE